MLVIVADCPVAQTAVSSIQFGLNVSIQTDAGDPGISLSLAGLEQAWAGVVEGGGGQAQLVWAKGGCRQAVGMHVRIRAEDHRTVAVLHSCTEYAILVPIYGTI